VIFKYQSHGQNVIASGSQEMRTDALTLAAAQFYSKRKMVWIELPMMYAVFAVVLRKDGTNLIVIGLIHIRRNRSIVMIAALTAVAMRMEML